MTTTAADFSKMTMSDARVWVAQYIDRLAAVAGRAAAIEVARETWREDAERASFGLSAEAYDRQVYLPMLLTALDELEES